MSSLNHKNFKLLSDLVWVLGDVWTEAPEALKRQFFLARVPKKALLDGNEVLINMTTGVFEGRTFFAYGARSRTARGFLTTHDSEYQYRSVGVENSVFLFAKVDQFSSPLDSELTVETANQDDLNYLVRLHTQLKEHLKEHRQLEQEEKEKAESQKRLVERATLPTMESAPADVDTHGYPLLHPLKSALLTICVIGFFPWSILISLLVMGRGQTFALVGALLRDAAKTIQIVLVVAVFLALLIAIAWLR